MMNKVASTVNIVNVIKLYEEKYGPSIVTAIEPVTTSSCIRYVITAKDRDGNEHRINVPAIKGDAFWRNQDHG